MIRLLPLLLMLLSPALASGQLLMVKAAPAPETTTNPSLEHPDVIWVAADGSVDETPTVLAGEIASYEILDDSLPGGWSFNTSTGQLTCADVGSSAIAGTIKIRAKNSAFVDIESTPDEYAEIRWRYHVYTSTDTISTADTFPFIASTAGCKYTVTEPITVDGSFAAITAAFVGIDLGGFTVTYDNGDTPIDNPAFETAGGSADLADGWDFTNASHAERFEGSYILSEVAYGGDWSLKFDAQIGASETVENETEIELEPDTWYVLQCEMYMIGGSTNCKLYVNLERQDEAGTIECSSTEDTSGAMKLVSTKFLTDEVGGTYKIIAGADNPDSDADYEGFIDAISVTRYRAMGVHIRTVDDETVPSSGLPSHPDISSYGSANGATITNGTLTQGADAGFECNAIRDRNSGAVGSHISHLTTNTNGNDTSAVYGRDMTQTELYASTFNSTSQFITSRSTFTGEVIFRFGGEMCYCEIDGGPHCGVHVANNPAVIHHNTISIKSRYTNGFGILIIDNDGATAYSNTIDNTGDYHGRGIFVDNDDDVSPISLHNNYITGHEKPLNQDWGGGFVLGGFYGIQIEGSENVSVFGNEIYAIADEHDAYAFRQDGTATGHSIHDNIFSAIRSGSFTAGSLKVQAAVSPNGFTSTENTLITNHVFLEARGCDDILIDRNTLTITGDGST